jgi:hypothetical protein
MIRPNLRSALNRFSSQIEFGYVEVLGRRLPLSWELFGKAEKPGIMLVYGTHQEQ